ncbi:MAG: DUF6377 domain-containing protein [Rikenellaceae bacterium]
MRNFTYFILLLFLPLNSIYSASFYTFSLDKKLKMLDKVLDSVTIYTEAKELRIKTIQSKITQNTDIEQRLLLNTMLYSEYAKYNSEAAFDLVVESIELCEKYGSENELLQWSLRKAYLYSASGLLKESKDILDSIRGRIESRTLLLDYYIQMEYLFSHFEQYTTGNIRLTPMYGEQKTSYMDSVSLVVQPKDDYFLINRGWKNISSDSTLYYLKKIENSFLSGDKSDIELALEAYTIARIYKENNNGEKYAEYLIYSAIYDIKSCNHDIASLQELSTIILEDGGNIERVYKYISYCLDRAKDYGDRVRTVEIATILDTTYFQLLERNRAQSRRLSIYLALMVLLLSVVLYLVVKVTKQVKKLEVVNQNLNDAKGVIEHRNEKLEQARNELSIVNQKIQTINEQLQTVNEKLIESNFIKEKYIGKSFEVCATHIGNMEKTCGKISSLVRGAKYDEVRKYCDSSFTLNKQLKELYQTFDDTFLSIYPDFVEKFNTLLLPDKQIRLKEGEILNTELRIYALIRLGVTDNQKIAIILHCSLQTIYNNYQKTKNRTELSNKDLVAKIMEI